VHRQWHIDVSLHHRKQISDRNAHPHVLDSNLLFIGWRPFAQAQTRAVRAFEVASIKPSAPDARSTGIARPPGRLGIGNVTLKEMIVNLKRRIEQIMDARDVPGLSLAKKAARAIAGAAVLIAPVLVGIASALAILAQSPSGVPQWQAAAGGHMAFDAASVKLMKPGSRALGRPGGFPL